MLENSKQFESEELTLTVRSRSTAFHGGSSALLASSSALLHIHVHTASSLSLFDEFLTSLLVDAESLLDSIVGVVK